MCEWRRGSSNLSAPIELDASLSTINRSYSRYSDLASKFLFTYSHNQQTGGEGRIVEIDKAVLAYNKHYRSRLHEHQVRDVGGVFKGHIHTFFPEIVESRSRITPIEMIRRKIAVGTTVLTDVWRGYVNPETICLGIWGLGTKL